MYPTLKHDIWDKYLCFVGFGLIKSFSLVKKQPRFRRMGDYKLLSLNARLFGVPEQDLKLFGV